MVTVIAILDFLFGCHHVHLSRVFTLQGETYKVCCDCAAKFGYSLETMSTESRLPLAPECEPNLNRAMASAVRLALKWSCFVRTRSRLGSRLRRKEEYRDACRYSLVD